MGRGFRRAIAGSAIAAGVVIASASPAFAHFCFRDDFNAKAAAHAGRSQAWVTADEWREFLPFIAEDCPQAVPVIEGYLDAADENTLFMGPGLLAGGQIFNENNDNGKGPQHFDYMLDAFLLCGEE